MSRRGGGIVLLAGGVVLLDQATKLVALTRLTPGVPVSLVDGFLALTLVMNPGLAFGLLGHVAAEYRWVVALISLVALLVLLRIALRVLPRGHWRDGAAIGLVFGGAVGNLIDRGRFGAVVDFVDVYYQGWHWPAFNVADSAITCGVALLALSFVTETSASTT